MDVVDVDMGIVADVDEVPAESVDIIEAESPDMVAESLDMVVVVVVDVSASFFCEEQAVASAMIESAKKADFAIVFMIILGMICV